MGGRLSCSLVFLVSMETPEPGIFMVMDFSMK